MSNIDQIRVINTFLRDLEVFQDDHNCIVSYSNEVKPNISMILRALDKFTDIVRYSNVRRSQGTTVSITCEDDVQDAIYFMLKPWIRDLTYESPTNKSGGRYVIEDFVSKSLRTVIEAKYIRNEQHAKDISKELHDDIEMYSRSNDFDYIVFFVYDPNSSIADPENLRSHIEVDRTINGKIITVHLLIKP